MYSLTQPGPPRRVHHLLAALALALLPTAAPAQSSIASNFDHYTTGFRLDGEHQFAACESCHTDGMFVGTPRDCVGCHTESSRVRATTKTTQHVLTSERCDACHRTSGFIPIMRMDHLEAFGSCASCHDGRRARGKPPDHVPAGEMCDDCHRTTAFVPAAFSHDSIVDNCASCHNGVVAMGKPVTHIQATNLCEDCHNVLSFSPVARVDHSQVLGTCSSCHNGVTATGQHPQHTPTTAECDTCHNTIAWR